MKRKPTRMVTLIGTSKEKDLATRCLEKLMGPSNIFAITTFFLIVVQTSNVKGQVVSCYQTILLDKSPNFNTKK